MSESKVKKFAFGGLAGMGATTVVQPLDLIKTRLQLQGEGGKGGASVGSVLRGIVREEGFRGLYRGLSAALFRQVTYSTTRFGVFQTLIDRFGGEGGHDLTFASRIAFGAIAGGLGAVVGNPAEVSLVRMTADGHRPAAERRGYRNVFDALRRVVMEEGVLTLWRGTGATVSRAMLLNAAQLGSYSQAKASLHKNFSVFSDPTSLILHSTAGMISGFTCTVVSLPVDITKTRVQNMHPLPDGRMPYSGALDCAVKVVRKEGILSLWKGFTPYFFRLGPHTIIAFLFLEQLNKHFSKSSM